MKKIKLTRGKHAIVDDADFEDLVDYPWVSTDNPLAHSWYAVRYEMRQGKQIAIKMHRQILDVPAGCMVDHVNKDGLDNRKSNLRICTHQQNMCNRRQHKHSSAPYKGIGMDKGKWRARITTNNKRVSLGSFSDPMEAALAYDRAAVRYHGEFASTNF